jgi:uncharacterized protein (UPF0212 family)
MAYTVHEQYLDRKTGFHVIELRDERGHRHFVQIAVGFDHCPACGYLTPKNNLGEIDPTALVAEVNVQLNAVNANLAAYAEKHKLKVK